MTNDGKIYWFTMTLMQTLRERAGEGDFVEYVRQGVEHYMNELQGHAPDVQRAAVHNTLNGIFEHDTRADITCRRGCAACCELFVIVTKAEAEHLANVVRERGMAIDTERLKIQAARPEHTWRDMPRAERTCVFLDPDTRTCRVYDDRPMSCRKYHVASTPELCDLDLNKDRLVQIAYSLDAEMVATAWMTLQHTEGLAKHLLEVL